MSARQSSTQRPVIGRLHKQCKRCEYMWMSALRQNDCLKIDSNLDSRDPLSTNHKLTTWSHQDTCINTRCDKSQAWAQWNFFGTENFQNFREPDMLPLIVTNHRIGYWARTWRLAVEQSVCYCWRQLLMTRRNVCGWKWENVSRGWESMSETTWVTAQPTTSWSSSIWLPGRSRKIAFVKSWWSLSTFTFRNILKHVHASSFTLSHRICTLAVRLSETSSEMVSNLLLHKLHSVSTQQLSCLQGNLLSSCILTQMMHGGWQLLVEKN